MFQAAPTLETPRLRLRAFRLEDFEPFAALHASLRSIYVDGPKPRAAAWTEFAAAAGRWALVGYGAWTIERKSDAEPVGLVSLNYPEPAPERELGWMLWEAFEGAGYATEAAARAKAFAFEDLGWDVMVSYIDPGNTASIKVAERLGAVLDPDAPKPDNDPALVYRHRRPA
ncbi:MAG: GNAT family N-acetyltransferase [Pseudomonadota bacterium]